MTYTAKLQDALQETVVAIGDVIRVQASEMRKNTRCTGALVGRGARSSGRPGAGPSPQHPVADQRVAEARRGAGTRAWHVERAAAAEQLAAARLERVESPSEAAARTDQERDSRRSFPRRSFRQLGKMSRMMMDPLRKPGGMSCTTGFISPLWLQLWWTRPSRSSCRPSRAGA